MQPNAKKLATDVIFLVESTPFIGVCYDLILDNYLKPLIQHFYGTSNFDDLGLIKDLSGVVFSAITYKGLTSLPSSICTHVQPTSHAKLFYDKLDHLLESFILEDQAHMAEGFALALDLFEDLENRRRGNKSERVASNRHIILVASQSAYDEVPIFESNNYRGLKYEEILQSLQKLQVNLSIISPSFRPEFIRLYEKVNNSGSGQNQGEFKLDKYGNFTFFNALHNSIQLVDYEAQQQKLQQQLIQQKQLAQKQAAEAAAAAAQQAAQQNVPVAVPAATQETIKMETNQPSVVIAPQQPVAAAYQQQQQQAPQSQQNFQQTTPYQQQQQPTSQPQQPQQTLQQQKIVPQQPPTQMGDIYAQQQQQAPVATAAKPAVVTAPVQIHPQQQTQQQAPHQMQIPGQANQVQNPPSVGGGQNLPTMQQPTQQMPPMQQIPTQPQVQQNIQQPIIRPALNIAQSQQIPQQPPQMANIRQMGAAQVIQQPQTQTIMGGPQVGAAVVPNQGGQQPNLQGQYGQMNPSPATTPVQQQVYTQQQQQPSQTPQTTQQQQQTSGFGYNTQQPTSASAAAAPVAGNRHAIWTGQIEWAEKDRNNPNIKSNHYANATMYSFMNAIDPNTGEFVSEVSHASAQAWPNKISLQMMSKQILDILMPLCGPPARNLILHTDNQDVKNSLTSIGGALINFANINTINLDVKVILVMCQNNEIICKIPADQTKFMNALKQIIAKQKQQQQQRMQQVAQPQQPTPQQPQPTQQPQMIQPQMQMNQVGAPMMQGMVPQQPGQIMMQPNMQANANNWINVPQQMQPQQPQMYMQQNMMTQQQQQQQQQQPKQNFNFGGQNY